MYFGLNLTFASSFQMLRGSVMFFTAVLSVIFLKAGFLLAPDFWHLRWSQICVGFYWSHWKPFLASYKIIPMGWYWHCYYWLRWVKPYDSEPMTHSLRVIFWTTRDNLISIVGVGVSDLLKEINGGSSKDLSKVLIGDGMIIFAQIIVAAQMVIEEKFVNGKNIHPLRLIDWLENISKIHPTSGMFYQKFWGCEIRCYVIFDRNIDFS